MTTLWEQEYAFCKWDTPEPPAEWFENKIGPPINEKDVEFFVNNLDAEIALLMEDI